MPARTRAAEILASLHPCAFALVELRFFRLKLERTLSGGVNSLISQARVVAAIQADPGCLGGTSRQRSAQAELRQDFLRGTISLFGGTFHITLEIHRGMFSREEYVLLAHGLVTGKDLILPDTPIRI